MESLAITDAQISASSEYNDSYAASDARLYYKGGWVAATNDENQWLEVDMESQLTRVARISTQGAHSDGLVLGWVTSYQLQFSSDGVDFQNYPERENANSTVRHLCFLMFPVKFLLPSLHYALAPNCRQRSLTDEAGSAKHSPLSTSLHCPSYNIWLCSCVTSGADYLLK